MDRIGIAVPSSKPLLDPVAAARDGFRLQRNFAVFPLFIQLTFLKRLFVECRILLQYCPPMCHDNTVLDCHQRKQLQVSCRYFHGSSNSIENIMALKQICQNFWVHTRLGTFLTRKAKDASLPVRGCVAYSCCIGVYTNHNRSCVMCSIDLINPHKFVTVDAEIPLQCGGVCKINTKIELIIRLVVSVRILYSVDRALKTASYELMGFREVKSRVHDINP